MLYFVELMIKIMNKTNSLFLLVLILLTVCVGAQNDEKSLQSYTPSVLINKGKMEFKMFNNLYTQTQFFDEEGTKKDGGNRSTFFNSIINFNYGLSSRFTIGGELWFKSTKVGSSPFGVLSFTNDENSRSAISGVGMKVKFNPIKKWGKLSVQSTLLVNVLSDPESENLDQPFLDNNRHQWITKVYYDYQFGDKFSLFTQLSTWVSIDKELGNDDMGVAVPIDLFLSYFATKKITFYMQNQYWPSLGDDGISSYFYQSGLGAKYLISNGIEVEGLYTKFLFGENSGAGETFNLGLRILY
jgi:hypothetical protein